jgi:hypothetical protein
LKKAIAAVVVLVLGAQNSETLIEAAGVFLENWQNRA